MKRVIRKSIILLVLVIVFVSSVITGCTQQPIEIDNATQNTSINEMIKDMEKVVVKKVVDGDTFETEDGYKVRLIGCDTPETVKPNHPVEFYGKEASDFTKKMLTGKTVYMKKDVGDTDKYGRLLRYVYLEDGIFYNEYLIKEGYARVMTIQPNVAFQDSFLEAERYARENNKGLWGKEDTQQNNQINANTSNSGLIKGNINSSGEKIYHIPGQKYYDKVKPEQIFNTEEDAINAGFRKSKM